MDLFGIDKSLKEILYKLVDERTEQKRLKIKIKLIKLLRSY